MSHGVRVLPPWVRMMLSPCCGRGVPHSAPLESPPREGDRSMGDGVSGKWGAANAQRCLRTHSTHPARGSSVPIPAAPGSPHPQASSRGAAAGLQPPSPLGTSCAGGSARTHAVQFSTTSPKPSSTSRLVATLAKPWGTSSHSSKRTPVPSE